MTPEFVAAIAGALISLVLFYFPKVKDWFNSLASDKKQLVNLGAVLFVSLVIFGINCTQWADDLGIPFVSCDTNGVIQVIKVIGSAIVANAGAYVSVKYLADRG